MPVTLPLVPLDEFNARIDELDSGFQIVTPLSTYGVIPFSPDLVGSEVDSHIQAPIAPWAVQHIMATTLRLEKAIAEAARDPDLTTTGQSKRLQPVRDKEFTSLAGVKSRFAGYEVGVDKEYASRYRIAGLDRNDIMSYMEGREIRDQYRELSREDQVNVMGKLELGEDRELMLAILRSPAKFGRLEQHALNGWRRFVDVSDPVGLEKIKLDRASIDWAKRSMAVFEGRLMKMIGYDRAQLYDRAKETGSVDHFGFTPYEKMDFERRKQFRRSA